MKVFSITHFWIVSIVYTFEHNAWILTTGIMLKTNDIIIVY